MNGRGARAPRRRVDGVLLLDKPVGVSSNAALQRARRAYNAEKAGHTGTLDPLASGLLPVCFGEAAKFARFLLDADKRYTATVRFGVTTTTLDAEGEVVARSDVTIDRADIEAALPAFTGRIRQVPPAYSALKHQGRSHYEYARAGIDVPREAREIHVASLRLIEWATPDAVLEVACSKGTYVRTLAADLGEALRCGAHLAALRRTATGGFDIAAAIALDRLEATPVEARDRLLLPVDALLGALPRVEVGDADALHLRHGRPIVTECPHGAFVRVYDGLGNLLGVVSSESETLTPLRMMASG